MATLKFIGFIGELPRLMPRVLPDMAAQEAINTRLTDGGLEPIRRPKKIIAAPTPPTDDIGTIYRYNSVWYSWEGLVHLSPGPVAGDRLYWTGDGAPKMLDSGTENTYDLAVVAPTTKLAGAISGVGDGNVETRLYVYTHVTSLGEESEPSPLSDPIAWEGGQTVTLSGFQLGDPARAVTTQRIYRSQTSESGDTQLYFIAERASSTADYVDTVDPSDIVEPLPSLDYNTPPATLAGLTAMPNGMFVGFVGKTLYFCEPYRPHAWPVKYTLEVDYPIVGLGAFGTSVAIMTEGNPYIVTGSHPDSMVMEKLELNLPCLTPWGIADLGYAVAYPSHDGLVVVSSQGAKVATEQLFSRDDWQNLEPANFAGSHYDGRYYASYVFTNDLGLEERGTMIFDLTGEQPFVIRTTVSTRSFWYEIETGYLYFLENGLIYQWDAPGRPFELQTWRSKEIIMPKPVNFGAIYVDVAQQLTNAEFEALLAYIAEQQDARDALYDTGDIGDAINGEEINVVAVNGDLLPIVPTIAGDLTVNVYADDTLRASVNAYNRMTRLPAGFKARKWVIEVTGNMKVEQVALATTGIELGAV